MGFLTFNWQQKSRALPGFFYVGEFLLHYELAAGTGAFNRDGATGRLPNSHSRKSPTAARTRKHLNSLPMVSAVPYPTAHPLAADLLLVPVKSLSGSH